MAVNSARGRGIIGGGFLKVISSTHPRESPATNVWRSGGLAAHRAGDLHAVHHAARVSVREGAPSEPPL